MIGNIENIDFAGVSVFRKDPDNILKSEIFGIPLYAIGIAGLVIWAIKKQ